LFHAGRAAITTLLSRSGGQKASFSGKMPRMPTRRTHCKIDVS
jgi:hypothetical protein